MMKALKAFILQSINVVFFILSTIAKKELLFLIILFVSLNVYSIGSSELDDVKSYENRIESYSFYSTNDVPTDIKLDGGDTDFINENRPVGSLVSILTSNDSDPGDTLTFTLVSGVGDSDNGSFYIERHNKLMLNTVPDYETKNSYSIRLRVDDGHNGTYEEAFTISVIDIVNEQTDVANGIKVWDFNNSNEYDISDNDKLKVDQGVAQLISVSEFQVNDAVNDWQMHPRSAVLNNGDIIIVWQSNDKNHTTNAVGQANDNSDTHIAAKIINPDGSVVLPEFQVNDEVENWQDYPDVTILQNGQIFISWYSKDLNHSTNSVGQTNDNDEEHIAAKIYNPDGSVVVPEFQVNDEIELREYFPNASILNNGQIFITWASGDTLHTTNAVGQDNDGSIRHISAKILNSDGTTAVSEFQINDEVEDLQTHPRGVVLNDGKIFVVWASKDFTHTTNAVGQTNDNDHYHIAAKIYNSDGSVSVSEFQVNDEIENIQDLPIPVVMQNGQIFITWETRDYSHNTNGAGQINDNVDFHIAAKIYNPDGSLAKAEFQVNDKTLSDQKAPRAVVIEDGKIFITWQSKDYTNSTNPAGFPKDGDNFHIAAKILNPDGTTSKEEFQVNYEVELWQTEPEISLLANGNVLLTWYSKDNYHSTSIAGQTYDNSVNHIAGIILSKDGIAAEFPASYARTNPNVSFTNPLSFKTTLTSFETILSNNNEGVVKYQVSIDGGVTWLFYDGTAWQTTSSNDGTNTNIDSEIDNNIASLADDGGSFNCRAFLMSNGSQKVELDQINLSYVLSYDVSGIVFYDENGDGIRDISETIGLQDVTVKLYNDSNNNGIYDIGETLFKETETQPDGTYKFEKVFDGNYVIVVDKSDSALNNDPNNNSLTYGLTTPEQFAINVAGLDLLDIDFGFDDAKVTLSIDQESIPENGGIAIVQVSIHPTTGFTTTVNISTSGVAVDAVDYVDQNDNAQVDNKDILIAANATNEILNILAVDDNIVENDESVIVDINTVLNATEDGVQRDSTKILDDDADPSIEITKTSQIIDDLPVGIGVGDLIDYTIKVENTGNVKLFDVTVTDNLKDNDDNDLILDSGPTFFSANAGSVEGVLEIGETATYSASYTITQSDIDAKGVHNSATATGRDSKNTWVTDVSDDGDDLDGNTEDDPTETPLLDMYLIGCNCDDVLNYRGANTYYFHEFITVTGNEGLTVSLDFNVSQNIYDDNENSLNGNIVLNETSPGVYEYDFWIKYSESFTIGVVADNDASAQVSGECNEICNKTFAKNDVNITAKNTAVSGDVLVNDSDPEGDNQTVNTTAVNLSSNGTLVLNSNGSYTYTPNLDFVGVDVFRYEVCDDAPISVCDSADVYINVFEFEGAQNNPPVGVQDFNQTVMNVSTVGNVLVNDSDPDYDNILADETPVISPKNGSLMLYSNGDYLYTPFVDFVGLDTFYYRLCDDGSPVLCDVTLAVIEVIDSKLSNLTFANDDAYIMKANEFISANVSDNDFDPEGDQTVVNTMPVLETDHGRVVLNDDGSFVYTPNQDFVGNDRFVYEICDNGNPAACDRASVYISVLEEPYAVVGDYVWHDIDGNGLQDNNEPGIEDVNVYLYSIKRTLVKSTTTNGQGFYQFNEILPGKYFLKFDVPEGYSDITFDNVGPDDSIDSDVDGSNGEMTTPMININKNDTINTIDAGFYKCVNIGDLVWLDFHKNNVYDSDEDGINGLRVELYKMHNDVWQLWDVDYTGINSNSICGDGYYSFCTNPGTYYLKFVEPPYGLVPVQPHRGNDNTKDSDVTRAHGYGTTNTFTFTSGSSGNTNIDAGYYEMSEVKNSMVWVDDNYNGIREAGEPGIANMSVEIYDAFGDLYSTTNTDENGEYNLDYLQAEDYYLKFIIPSEYDYYDFTLKNQGDDEHDSDVTGDYGYGTTEMFALQSGDDEEHKDAGLASASLPVNFLSVGAEMKAENDILVYWTTANEVDVHKYIVQKSIDNTSDFEDVGEVLANNKSSNSYLFDDISDFVEGIYYYRIIEIDLDGITKTSNVVAVFVSKSEKVSFVELYPNPARNNTILKLNLMKNSKVSIDLYDIGGNIVLKNIADKKYTKGFFDINVDVSQLSPATYFLRIKSDNEVSFRKLIVLGK